MPARFKPTDILSLCFIALLGVATVLFIPVNAVWGKLILTYALLASAITSLVLYQKRPGSITRFSYFYPAAYAVVILILFNSLGDLIPSLRHGRTFDAVLVRIDFALFGVHPTLWMEQFIHPALTTLFQLAYISYYFIPLSLGAVLIMKNRDRELDEALFGIALCFYLSYIGYILVPAFGPRFSLDQLQSAGLEAGPITETIRDLLNRLEHNKTDAFPSGHTAVALMSLYYAWKHREKTLYRILAPLVSALIVSTVYLRYHYVIDVIAGVLLFAITALIAPASFRALSRRNPLG